MSGNLVESGGTNLRTLTQDGLYTSLPEEITFLTLSCLSLNRILINSYMMCSSMNVLTNCLPQKLDILMSSLAFRSEL